MKVFISWSGENSASHKVAKALGKWLPDVLDKRVVPFVSSLNIDKGERGLAKIQEELKESELGIICVTEKSKNSPWLLFEAGALSSKFGEKRVMPFLFKQKTSDLMHSPISQFQATEYPNDEEVEKLIKSINDMLGDNKLSDTLLERSFKICYPNLKKELSDIKPEEFEIKDEPENKTDINEKILEEILKITQNTQRLLVNSNENMESIIKDITTENAKRFSMDMAETVDKISDLKELYPLTIDSW